MDNQNNFNNQNNQQYSPPPVPPMQNAQNAQRVQTAQTVQPPQNNMTKGELFVGMNLLSKIGVIFIIVGIIAFSAVSGEYISAPIRMVMVAAVGLVMLGGGELFRRKSSPVFASALSFGGIAELFIAALIGQFGFEVWGPLATQIIGLVVAATGIFLSVCYRSQSLLAVTQICASMPFFASWEDPLAVYVGAVCLMAVHAGAAIIARKRDYVISIFIGISLIFVHTFSFITILYESLNEVEKDSAVEFGSSFGYLPLIFLVCAVVCYVGGLALNAAQNYGKLCLWETTAMVLAMLPVLICLPLFMGITTESEIITGVACAVAAVVFAVVGVAFEFRFLDLNSVSAVMYNFAVPFAIIAVGCLFSFSGTAVYAAFHILAVVLIALNAFAGRKLFWWWGLSLLIVSEIAFMAVLADAEGGERAFAIILNLVLWFALMAIYIIKKKHETTGFRVYTCLAFANAGILLSTLILNDLRAAMREALFTGSETALLCTLLTASAWMVLGFAVGKPKFLKTWGMVSSILFYAAGMLYLFFSNIIQGIANAKEVEFSFMFVMVTIIVNIVSVLTVLDLTMQITAKQSKFGKAVGLIVSAYGLMSLTSVLGMNNAVAFTSWIISVIYIVAATLWILIGFKKRNALLRRFGLALVLLAAAKLFLFDFGELEPIVRTLMFIGFGITLLGIAFGYGIAEKKLKSAIESANSNNSNFIQQ